jgi:hypothetical protein
VVIWGEASAKRALYITRAISVIYFTRLRIRTPTMTLKRGLLQILLAALLLAAQYTAITHPFRHWQPSQLAQSQQDDGGRQKSQSGLCDFHVAFAEILGAVGSCALPVVTVAQATERSADPLSSPRTAKLLVPLSRGPPVLV